MDARKGAAEIISSCLVIPSQLKKSSYKGGTKIVPFRFLSDRTSHINSPLLAPTTKRNDSISSNFHPF